MPFKHPKFNAKKVEICVAKTPKKGGKKPLCVAHKITQRPPYKTQYSSALEWVATFALHRLEYPLKKCATIMPFRAPKSNSNWRVLL